MQTTRQVTRRRVLPFEGAAPPKNAVQTYGQASPPTLRVWARNDLEGFIR